MLEIRETKPRTRDNPGEPMPTVPFRQKWRLKLAAWLLKGYPTLLNANVLVAKDSTLPAGLTIHGCDVRLRVPVNLGSYTHMSDCDIRTYGGTGPLPEGLGAHDV
jgi:hypothetical protein